MIPPYNFPQLSLNDRVKIWKHNRIDAVLAEGKQLDGTTDSTYWCAAHRLADDEFNKLCEENVDAEYSISDLLTDEDIPTEYSTPITDAERHELIYLRDLAKIAQELRMALITCNPEKTNKGVYGIQDFLRLQESMDWQGYESYPHVGSHVHKRLNK